MNSPFANIFLAIQARIQTAVPAIKHIDQDFGQLEDHNGDNRPPVAWPCVLIDMDNFTWSDYGNNVQSGVGNVIIRIGFPPYSSTSQNTPQQWKQKALEYYDIEYSVHAALQGWETGLDNVHRLDRTSVATEKREDFIRVRQLVYSIAIEDYANEWPQTVKAAALVIDTEVTT